MVVLSTQRTFKSYVNILKIFRLFFFFHPSNIGPQRSGEEAADINNQRDTENGHLIYKNGDILVDRCRYWWCEEIKSWLKYLEKSSYVLCFFTNLPDRWDHGHSGGGNVWEGGAVCGPQQVTESNWKLWLINFNNYRNVTSNQRLIWLAEHL